MLMPQSKAEPAAPVRFISHALRGKINIENNGRSPDTMEKLGSIPRTPTLRVLAAQQDLAFCFVYVKCWGTNAMFLLRDLLRVLRFSSASQFYHPRVEHRERHKMVVTRSSLIFSISRSHLVKNASRVYISCAALAPRLLSISDKR